jgi:hypothetical protein
VKRVEGGAARVQTRGRRAPAEFLKRRAAKSIFGNARSRIL